MMVSARIIFGLAGISGLALLLPLYWSARTFAPSGDAPFFPVFFYGFVGVAAAFQTVFLMIAYQVERFRLLMIPSIVEKAGFSLPLIWLWWHGRLPDQMIPAAIMDTAWMILFMLAFWMTRGTVPMRH